MPSSHRDEPESPRMRAALAPRHSAQSRSTCLVRLLRASLQEPQPAGLAGDLDTVPLPRMSPDPYMIHERQVTCRTRAPAFCIDATQWSPVSLAARGSEPVPDVPDAHFQVTAAAAKLPAPKLVARATLALVLCLAVGQKASPSCRGRH